MLNSNMTWYTLPRPMKGQCSNFKTKDEWESVVIAFSFVNDEIVWLSWTGETYDGLEFSPDEFAE